MDTRSVGIAGDSPAAQAYLAGGRVLGWACHRVDLDTDDIPSGEIIVPAPLAPSLTSPDHANDAAGRYAFGWPLISTAPIQELLRRFAAVGPLTAISSRSTRPAPVEAASRLDGVLFRSAHDQVALTLLTARLGGLGAPVSVSASGTTDAGGEHDSVDVDIGFGTGLIATVHADWCSPAVVSREFQVAGELGVLRSETDPRPALEFNGGMVPLPAKHIADEQHRSLHESGVIDMLTTIGAGFDSGALPHAFTVAFGREVLDVITAAQSELSVAPWPAPAGPVAGSHS